MTALVTRDRDSLADPDAAPGIELDGITKRYGTFMALDGLSVHVPDGSLTVVVGPSGCGKSTTLRVLSGLEAPDAGRVLLGGADVTRVPPDRRGLAMVFQDFALYPHMTVAQNIGFGLRMQAKHDRRQGPGKAEIARRVGEVCDLLGLAGLQGRRPSQLSGGQRQRTALARAIVRRPDVLLLDEPLSNLDAQLRQQARAELMRLHRELATTLVHVTHDQYEALSMATHLVVLDHGRLAQAGTPEDLYRCPADVFVARFVGQPAMNVHAVRSRGHGGGGSTLEVAGLQGSVAADLPPQVQVGWRPVDGVLVDPDDGRSHAGPGLSVQGTVDVVEFTGDGQLASCGGQLPFALMTRGTSVRPGDHIEVHVPADRLHVFAADTGLRLPG